MNYVQLQSGSNPVFPGDLNASSVQMDASQTLTRTYNWGTVKVNYAVSGSKLTITTTMTNTSSVNTIVGLFYEPIGLKFPAAVQEYDGNIPMLGDNISGPTLLSMSYGSGVMVMANEDVVKPLALGFPWALDRPANTFFPLRANTNRDGMYPTFFPFINRPIAPGGSDQYQISLRFGPPGSTIQTLAGDIYSKFAAAFPRTVSWTDGRPIGALILATAAAGYRTNPRGWFLDPNVDVTTPAGIAAFQARVLTYADSYISILKNMNAQGMITWDIEGEQFPHPTSYNCDPTQLALLAPEMNAVADAYFKKFRDAGLKVGVCIRPQQLVVAPNLSSASQVDLADPTNLLISKMQYAKSRWGATMFYVDSNGGPNDPIDPAVFQRVTAALPDVLIIPEHRNLKYYAYTAPLLELHDNVTGTAPLVKTVYPNAYSSIFTPEGPISQDYNILVNSVKQGDILIFRAWFDDQPANSLIKGIYQDAGKTTPAPTVSVTTPAAGATVSGTITVTATASSAGGVAGVQFKLDGANLGAEVTTPPYQVSWNTTGIGNGSHTLSAVVRDSTGATAPSAGVAVTVNNAAALPTVSITSPAAGTTVSGTITVTASPNSSNGVAGVQFKLDGANLGAEVTAAPYQVSWNTTGVGNGSHTLSAVVRSTTGATAPSAGVAVTVNNITPPSVSMTAPATGATVSGTVTVSATANSSSGVAGVQFKLDGANLGAEVTAAPYQLSWNTNSVANGSHTLSAVLRSTTGATAPSTGVAVTVNNAALGTNVALNKPSQQSSFSAWSKTNDAQGGNDGIKNGSFGFHTSLEPKPWWQVDLQQMIPLNEIRVFNRLDVSPERSRTIQVLLSADAVNWTLAFANPGTTFGGIDGKPLVVGLGSVQARYVRLQLNESNYLHLDEVEVYSTNTVPPVPAAPVISNVRSSNVTPSSATITWTTDTASDSQVDYGTTLSYGASSALNSSAVTSHSVTLTGLAASTVYHFQVKSKDSNGLLSTSNDSTLSTPAATPPSQATNIALNKPAQQSSTAPWSKPNDAQGGDDGVKNGSFGFHTNLEQHPWWQVDLQQLATIGEVRVFNRLDFAERSRTLQVLLSSDGVNWQVVYTNPGTILGGVDGNPLRVMLNSLPGRYVRLQLNESTYLHLDEIEVYSSNGSPAPATPNIALKKPAQQSSTSGWSTPNDAQGGDDGVKNGSFGFHTNLEPNPWWQVDLQQVTSIGEVRVFNRLDYNPQASRTLKILLSSDGTNWQVVYTNPGTVFGGVDGNPLRVMLDGLQGRYIRLQLNETTYLHLDEVEVY